MRAHAADRASGGAELSAQGQYLSWRARFTSRAIAQACATGRPVIWFTIASGSRDHRLAHRRRIQPVHRDAPGAQLLQLARARRRRRHLMPTGHQLWHQTTPDHPGPACTEHSHNLTPNPLLALATRAR